MSMSSLITSFLVALGIPLARPSLWFIGLCWAGFALLSLAPARCLRVAAWGWRLLGLGLGGFTLVLLLPVGDWALCPLEERIPRAAPPARVDGIMVLGGGVDPELTTARGIPALNAEAERMTAAVALAHRYPYARLVFAGGAWGPPRPGALPEAEVARQLFLDLGIPAERLLLEAASRNTYENALFAQALARPAPGEVWVLVTSARHMPRALGVFRHLGWEVLPWPVAYRTTGESGGLRRLPPPALLGQRLTELDSAAHEWFGLALYRLAGRTDAFFPGPAPATRGGSQALHGQPVPRGAKTPPS